MRFLAWFCCLTLVLSLPISASSIIDYTQTHHSEMARHGMVVAQEQLAADIGRDVLAQGGNAVDAAVAVGYALAVTLPRAGNLGGGGFMLLHLAESKQTIALDYRETAPAAAKEDLFLTSDKSVDIDKARFSHAAVGVPGTVAGLNYALKKWGTLPLKTVIQPAIELAEKGIKVAPSLYDAVQRKRELLQSNPATKAKFFKNEQFPQLGEVWRQPDLAWSLKQIKQTGSQAFYQGEIAKRIVQGMQRNAGLITLEDLANYKVMERRPVKGEFNGYQIAAMPPPSSGGIHLIQMLNMLAGLDIGQYQPNTASQINLLAEVAKFAYADRSVYLGDPDFVEVPVERLVEKAYALKLSKRIKPGKLTPAKSIKAGNLPGYESPDTTHYSVMDKWGNAVANTYTLNHSFGSGITAAGTGILLNNEMDDFSAKPGVPNSYGLIGGSHNKIEGRKRPLSSMTPVIVFDQGKPFLVTGSPGGSRIINVVTQLVLHVTGYGMDLASASMLPRIHHQWLPDKLFVEPSLSPDSRALLQAMGYQVESRRAMGSTQSIMYRNGLFYGFADPRRPGAKAIGL